LHNQHHFRHHHLNKAVSFNETMQVRYFSRSQDEISELRQVAMQRRIQRRKQRKMKMSLLNHSRDSTSTEEDDSDEDSDEESESDEEEQALDDSLEDDTLLMDSLELEEENCWFTCGGSTILARRKDTNKSFLPKPSSSSKPSSTTSSKRGTHNSNKPHTPQPRPHCYCDVARTSQDPSEATTAQDCNTAVASAAAQSRFLLFPMVGGGEDNWCVGSPSRDKNKNNKQSMTEKQENHNLSEKEQASSMNLFRIVVDDLGQMISTAIFEPSTSQNSKSGSPEKPKFNPFPSPPPEENQQHLPTPIDFSFLMNVDSTTERSSSSSNNNNKMAAGGGGENDDDEGLVPILCNALPCGVQLRSKSL
jgi:hypothetical protein